MSKTKTTKKAAAPKATKSTKAPKAAPAKKADATKPAAKKGKGSETNSEAKGKKVSAVYLYKRIVKDFPRTAAAEEAVKRLREIDPKGNITGKVGRGVGGTGPDVVGPGVEQGDLPADSKQPDKEPPRIPEE